MEIETKIIKLGNDIGIRIVIPKEIIKENNLKIGDLVKINFLKDRISMVFIKK